MENVNNNGQGKTAVTVIAILAAFLLVAFLVKQMVNVTQPAPVDAARAAARTKDNADIRAAGAEAAKHWGYVDPTRGIVRVPLDDAIKLTLKGYREGDFHSNLLSRVEKAAAAPKNDYE